MVPEQRIRTFKKSFRGDGKKFGGVGGAVVIEGGIPADINSLAEILVFGCLKAACH
jgi:hypothetical protein